MKNMLKFLTIFGVALGFAAMSACSMETDRKNNGKGDPGTPTEVSASISLSVPGQFAEMQTRALTGDQEVAVENAMVLLFDASDKFEQMFEVESGKINSTGLGEATIGLQLPGGQHKLVVIANASADVKAQITAADAGAAYTTLMARLNKDISGKMFTATGDDAIPMWGETAGTMNVTTSFNTDIDLVRSVARVDIGVGKWNDEAQTWTGTPLVTGGTKIPFEITEVYLVRANDAYSIVPVHTEFYGDAPSVPAGTAKFAADAANFDTFKYVDITPNGTTTFTSRSIYLPEVVVTGVAHSEKTALVVGGRYDGGDETFYRVDFLRSGVAVDVLRNHLYRFEVTNVFGKGYDSAQVAYEATSSNMTAEVLDWTDEPFDDIVFNGEKSFAVRGLSDDAARAAVLGSPLGSTHTVTFATNIPAFEMKAGGTTFKSTDFVAGGSAAKTTTDFSYVLTLVSAGNYKLDITTRASNIGGAAAKTDVWAIDAGPGVLKYTLTVSQTNDATDPTSRAVTATAGDGGTAMANKAMAKQGDEVKIVATASSGMIFAGWTSSDITITAAMQASPTLTFTMPATAVSVSAAFTQAQVTIGGVIWSNANVDAPGKFAESAVAKGRLYQYGSTSMPAGARYVGWTNTDNAATLQTLGANAGIDKDGNPVAFTGNWTNTAWSNDAPTEGWTYDPCPSGWRVPTWPEIQVLIAGTNSASNTAIQTVGGVQGREFTISAGPDAGKKLFLPLTGYRGNVAGTVGSTPLALYWSSSPSGTTGGLRLNFSNGNAANQSHHDTYGALAVRCVRGGADSYKMTVADDLTGGISSLTGGASFTINGTTANSGASAKVGATIVATASSPSALFAGWTASGAGAAKLVGLNSASNTATFAMPDGDLTLTAKWVAKEVMVNGTKWYGANLAASGTFAANASDDGVLFQWGYNTVIAGAAAGGTTYVNPTAQSDQFAWQTNIGTKGPQDPCPTGWRLPTTNEAADLIDARWYDTPDSKGGSGSGNYTTVAWETGVGKGATITSAGDSNKQLFFPNASARQATGAVRAVYGTESWMWTSESLKRAMFFSSDNTYKIGGLSWGFSTEANAIRCVSDDAAYNYVVTGSNDGHGTVAIKNAAGTALTSGTSKMRSGAKITYTATAASGYQFKNWTLAGGTKPVDFINNGSASDNSATNPITVIMPSGPAGLTLTATFEVIPVSLPTPVVPYMIYWDDASETMALGSWNNGPGGVVDQSNMLFFQFGSTIGFLNQEAASNGTQNFDASDIKFNLTTDTAYANLNNWTDWFADAGVTYSAATHGVDGFVSSSSYHNSANVQTGRGDPCKLVGLTIEQIKAGTIDNGKWRMPTSAEQSAEGWATYTGYGAYPTVNTLNTPAGVRNTAGHFLPAAGNRSTDGTPYYVGRNGYFWVSRPLNATNGYRLYFYSGSVLPAHTNISRIGSAVRCVREADDTDTRGSADQWADGGQHDLRR